MLPLTHWHPLKPLKVYLWNSDITERGVKRLRGALPDAKFFFKLLFPY